MDESRLVKKTYREAKARTGNTTSSWCNKVREILNRLGLEERWNSETVDSETTWKNEVKKRVHEEERRRWQAAMLLKPKLRVYRTFKTKLTKEPYLDDKTNWKGRQVLVGLRTGTNQLKIDKDRFDNIPEEWRLCPICAVETESEEHFVTRCDYYSDERQEWENKLTSEDKTEWLNLTDKQKLSKILNPCREGVQATKHVHFLTKCDQKRNRWMDANQPVR
jgi:hypothetical protein